MAFSVAASTLGVAWNLNSTENDRGSGEKVPDETLENGARTTSKTWGILSIPMLLINDVSRVSCSAAEASVKEGAAVQSVVSASNSKVMAPSLLGEHQPHVNRTGTPTGFSMRRRATLARMRSSKTRQTLESKYEVNPEPIGEGAFGQVFVARDRQTGELVAVKKIWKEYSDNQDFVREMSTLLELRNHGGHPHLCLLRENFDEPKNFALVLDLIKGGEV